MTAGHHIDYDALALEALRGVVKACLAQVARTGLVGDHHFYIAFNTQAPGVGMSKRLKEKYPVEMTIVLQHRFWDLAVEEDRFEVKLTFDGIPERLIIPFKAVKVFYDPSVPYGLQFEESEAGTGSEGTRRPGRRGMATGRDGAPASANGDRRPPSVERGDDAAEDGAVDRGERRRPQRRTRSERAADMRTVETEPAIAQPETGTKSTPQGPAPVAPPAAAQPQRAPAVVVVAKSDDPAVKTDGDEPKPANGAKIFDLSKFRGKK